ncbi:hypothetical protein [Hyunsoonleella pacifica]|uniref:SGNH/GDSL hydrolase family protein n=1 Tax=Hyunsoonleella pacifica TaxID=1080224 RepID=A0A4V2JB73_9FLAO|nr:hypothetical protein [Hyunsoonleella pacifica]TBN17648.1 hypothetical protein EYD46_04855 [Hyunsoonleella pacifica]GGD10152.1 hypothetical protein GCM10011368_10140 [Hyunsoonleella pacifica]
MFKFLRNIIFFFLAALVTGEVVVRLTHAVSDIPQRTIDKDGIQKYYPNQTGYWLNGTHTWEINDLGWPGQLPQNYDNLITIIGDSFIENFMNPNECHQAVLLKQRLSNYNFMEAARSGISFIEAFEISKQLDSLNPIENLIYVTDSDFRESIEDIKKLEDITQVDLKSQKVVYGKMKAPSMKKMLYNWKLAYYFYNRFPINFSSLSKFKKTTKVDHGNKDVNINQQIKSLLSYIKKNYDIHNKILVFHPNSDKEIIKLCKAQGFYIIHLNSSNDEKSWTFDYDHHWTCYGHEQVAEQVKQGLINIEL